MPSAASSRRLCSNRRVLPAGSPASWRRAGQAQWLVERLAVSRCLRGSSLSGGARPVTQGRLAPEVEGTMSQVVGLRG